MTLSRYQLERTDLLTEIEQGRKVEIELFQENHRSMNTLANLLWSRDFSKKKDVRFWERWNEYVPLISTSALRSSWVRHGIDCPCDGCLDATKRLLIDCGVLPKGRQTWPW